MYLSWGQCTGWLTWRELFASNSMLKNQFLLGKSQNCFHFFSTLKTQPRLSEKANASGNCSDHLMHHDVQRLSEKWPIQNTVGDLSPVSTQQVLTNVIHGDPSHEESLHPIRGFLLAWKNWTGKPILREYPPVFHPFASILPHCTVNPCVYKQRYNLS